MDDEIDKSSEFLLHCDLAHMTIGFIFLQKCRILLKFVGVLCKPSFEQKEKMLCEHANLSNWNRRKERNMDCVSPIRPDESESRESDSRTAHFPPTGAGMTEFLPPPKIVAALRRALSEPVCNEREPPEWM